MTHSNDNLGLYAFLGFGAGLYTFYKGFRQFRDYRLIADTPEIPIRSIPMGFVQVHGVAKGSPTLQSPVTHTPCFAYKVVIEKWKSDSNSNSSSWHHYRTDVEGVNFHLTDAGGHVLIDPRKAELDLPQMARCEAGNGRGATNGIVASEHELLQYVSKAEMHWLGGLAERGLEHVGHLSDPGKEQKRQALLSAFQHTPGTPDFMRQMVITMAPGLKKRIEAMGPQADPQKEQARQIMLEAFQYQPGSPEFMERAQRAEALAGGEGSAQRLLGMMQSQPQDGLAGMGMLPAASGRYRLTEYCILPDGTYDISGTCMENPSPQDEHDRNFISQGTHEKVFLISNKPEKQVESGLLKKALLKIFGGAGLSVICLAILLAKLGLL
jgi:hypothetical protein